MTKGLCNYPSNQSRENTGLWKNGGDKVMMNASALDEAEVVKAFLAIVCRSKACSQISRDIVTVCKTEGQPGVGQQQA